MYINREYRDKHFQFSHKFKCAISSYRLLAMRMFFARNKIADFFTQYITMFSPRNKIADFFHNTEQCFPLGIK